jgi:hypothetical protein
MICAIHEYGHRLQAAFPNLQKMFEDLHQRRTSGDSLKKLRTLLPNHGYGGSEYSREDHYIDPYWGKEYGGKPLEVLTMGFQTVLSGKNFDMLYTEDRRMLDFIVGILFHWTP